MSVDAISSNEKYPWLEETIKSVIANQRSDGSVNIQGVASETGVVRSTAQTRVAIAQRFMLKEKPFEPIGKRPSKDRSIEEILAHRRAESDRAIEYESGTKLFPVKIKTPGPIGLMTFGDPHIDNAGTNFRLFETHLKLAASRSAYIAAGNIGDVRDNWIGRLSRLLSHQTITGSESWKLAQWVFRDAGVNWTWLIRGNHDLWSGDNDPLDWISEGADVGIDQPHGVRLGFEHPNGTVTRMNARHDFPGNSIFNPLHALKREMLHGYRDHITIAGHRHMGADARDMIADLSFVMIRVSGYKQSDDFRKQIGAHAKPLHPAALVVVNPDKADDDQARVWTAPSVEEGVDYLDFLRKRYDRKRA